ncbi:helix-turn-helix domain-containing protein [Flavobacterium sp. HJ-32-4]
MVERALEAIRLQRLVKQYSQEYVAMRLNVSQSYYARLESGKAPLSLPQFFTLTDILEIDRVAFFAALG